MRSLCLLAVSIAAAAAFSTSSPRVARSSRTRPVRMEETAPPAAAPRLFELKIAMPSKKGTAALRFKARLPASEALVVRYAIPFGLDVAPKDGLAIVTKDGAGGEKVGDVLRYCTEWNLGVAGTGNQAGVVETLGTLAGALSWKLGLFDVAKARSWESVVEALTSNTDLRTDEVVLVFERPLKSASV